MKIIILGMDNTGKTTLSHQLSQELDLPIGLSKGPKLTKEEMEQLIKDNLELDDIIFERFCFFEEMVYGSILRGKSKFTFKDNIFKLIKEANPTIIYCRPNKNTILKWNDREQMDGVIDNSVKLLKKFDKVIKKLKKYGFKVIKYNYSTETMFDVIAKL